MKGRTCKLGLFLALGAILNVAVAWGCEYLHWEPEQTPTRYLRWVYSLREATEDEKASIYAAGSTSGMKADDFAQRVFVVVPSSGHGWSTRSVLERLRVRVAVADGRQDSGWSFAASKPTACLHDAGWPLRSVSGQEFFGQTARRSAIIQVGNPNGQEPISLPFRPIWPGFAIDTIFYAVVLWLPFAGLGALRCRRRVKRGLCPACAYDLRGRDTQSLTCPECGKAVKG